MPLIFAMSHVFTSTYSSQRSQLTEKFLRRSQHADNDFEKTLRQKQLSFRSQRHAFLNGRNNLDGGFK
jgi:hypothetical protein